MRINREHLEKKLEILESVSKGKLKGLSLDYYAIGGGYRVELSDGSSLIHARLKAQALADALDIAIRSVMEVL